MISGPPDRFETQSRIFGATGSLLVASVMLFVFPVLTMAPLSHKPGKDPALSLKYLIVPAKLPPVPQPLAKAVEQPRAKEHIVKRPASKPIPRKVAEVRKEKKTLEKQVVEQPVPTTLPVQQVEETPAPSAEPSAAPAVAGQSVMPDEPAAYEQTMVDAIPTAMSQERPEYPYRARRMNITGEVEIRFLVNREGAVSDLQILRADPDGIFEESVRKAVDTWRFTPGMKNGRPVATWMRTTINFEIE